MKRFYRKRAKPKPAKVEPLGEPVDWTDADIDRMAQITQEDVFCAVAHWRANAPKRAKGLLDARPHEEEGHK